MKRKLKARYVFTSVKTKESHSPYLSFGRRFSDARRFCGIRLSKMSKTLNIPIQDLLDMEAGAKIPNTSHYDVVAMYLKINPIKDL